MKTPALRKYRFPRREGNRFELLIDGERFFPRMLACIANAKHFILLEQYMFESGAVAKRFIAALMQAEKRGVPVNLLLDDYGSRGLEKQDRDNLIAGGINLIFYNPVRFSRIYHSLFRDHRKVLIVDGETAFVGGAGIADEFAPAWQDTPPTRPDWHDVMVQIQGPIVTDWVQVFAESWRRSTKKSLLIPERKTADKTGHQSGQVVIASALGRQEITRALINAIRKSTQHIWITTPYFVTTWKLRRNLRRAAKHGIDVRLLLPGEHSDHPWISHAGRRFYNRLLRHKVRIFEYQPRFTHSKIQLCDNWVSIGSSNLDRWNQRWSLDANQIIEDANFAKTVRELFTTNFKDSKEITLQQWQQRPWRQRLKEWWSSRIVALLEHISRGHN